MELILAFVFGMVIMDVIWAWRMGIPQAIWQRWTRRKASKTDDWS